MSLSFYFVFVSFPCPFSIFSLSMFFSASFPPTVIFLFICIAAYVSQYFHVSLPPPTTLIHIHPLTLWHIYTLDFSLNLITVRFLFLFYRICFVAYASFCLPISPCLSYFSLYFLILSTSLCLSCFFVSMCTCRSVCVSLCFSMFFSICLLIYPSVFIIVSCRCFSLLFCYFLSILLCQSLFSVFVSLSLSQFSLLIHFFSLFSTCVSLYMYLSFLSRSLSFVYSPHFSLYFSTCISHGTYLRFIFLVISLFYVFSIISLHSSLCVYLSLLSMFLSLYPPLSLSFVSSFV